MLRVTVELLPGGRTDGRRTLATADIWRTRSGARADYEFEMGEDLLPDQDWKGEPAELSSLVRHRLGPGCTQHCRGAHRKGGASPKAGHTAGSCLRC